MSIIHWSIILIISSLCTSIFNYKTFIVNTVWDEVYCILTQEYLSMQSLYFPLSFLRNLCIYLHICVCKSIFVYIYINLCVCVCVKFRIISVTKTILLPIFLHSKTPSLFYSMASYPTLLNS